MKLFSSSTLLACFPKSTATQVMNLFVDVMNEIAIIVIDMIETLGEISLLLLWYSLHNLFWWLSPNQPKKFLAPLPLSTETKMKGILIELGRKTIWIINSTTEKLIKKPKEETECNLFLVHVQLQPPAPIHDHHRRHLFQVNTRFRFQEFRFTYPCNISLLPNKY